MANWKRHFRVSTNRSYVATSAPDAQATQSTSAKYSSILPEIFAGHPNRVQRYYQFEDMSRDSDISAALDTIADFCTQGEEQQETPFLVHYMQEANETETKLLNEALSKWVKKNEFKQKLWKIFRDTITNGDTFFVCDPETREWHWIDHYAVELVKVASDGTKKPQEYVVRNFDPNITEKFGTGLDDISKYRAPGGSGSQASRPVFQPSSQTMQIVGSEVDPYNGQSINQQQYFIIDADKMIHLSLNEGMDRNWPFGASILESIFKTYKQKELLEDSILIYRVQRAPERRIFYIDVGDMQPMRAKAHIEAIKNEIHQRRIPNKTGGGGGNIVDAAYNPLCLDLETRIPLLDGRTLSIVELIEEHQAGKQNWAYSCDPATGNIIPGVITWAGITRRDAKVLRLTFDNGETLICTPDHKIPVIGKGFVEAQHLTTEDSLIAFNKRTEGLSSSSSDRTYEQIFDHELKEWVFTHRMVGNFFKSFNNHQEFTFLPENVDATKTIIHHKDFNRYNNDPRNLCFMNKEDHIAYHVHNRKDYWNNLNDEERNRIKTKISNSLRDYNASLSEQEKVERSIASTKRISLMISEMKTNHTERYQKWRNMTGKSRSKYLQENPMAMIKWLSGAKTFHQNYPNRSLTVSPNMLGVIVNTIKKVGSNRKNVMAAINQDTVYAEAFKEANPPINGLNELTTKLSDRQLSNIIRNSGYKSWKDLVSKVPQYNHRLTKIEHVENRDVGTITIDFEERWNSHHTFAIEAGIFVKNSMLDDYFFAQTAEGRGSKVETLPGGDSLGEIGDLSYFTKKMARGLKIPTSYLSLGDEETPASYNDGRLGQTLIQEFKFNKYCMRLQNLLSPVFDKEFKSYLDDSGISIDEGLFELQFNPPQNFMKYRQIELDLQQTQVYSQVRDVKFLAERFKMSRFLGLREDEILENEKLYVEENAAKFKKSTGTTPAESEPDGDLGSVGVRPPSGDFDFSGGFGGGEDLPPDGEADFDADGGGDMNFEGGSVDQPTQPSPNEGTPT